MENVVSLSVNIRAPGVLSQLQAEMREGKISDAMWDLYMSRVVQPGDCRLQQPPFSTSAVQFVVHRHSIRVRQSFCNAETSCRRLRRRLYLVQAADAVAMEDEKHFTPDLRKNLLGATNPRNTKGLSSFLPLYQGMRLLLGSKDCVRYGLMKGCECILEHIVFCPLEELPGDVVAGEPILLRYMPVALVLRAIGAAWELPREATPELPPDVDRRGLFTMRPTSEYFKCASAKNRYINVRRTQYTVLPADTRIVYAAQGETFEAVIADMQRPPRMPLDTFWLACYVMLSRATSLEGVLILRPAARGDLSRPPPRFLVEEIDRLLAVERTSTKRLRDHLQQLHTNSVGVVPSEILDLLAPDAEEVERIAVAKHRSMVASSACRMGHQELGATCPRNAPASQTTLAMGCDDGTAAKRRRLRGKQAPTPSVAAPSSPEHKRPRRCSPAARAPGALGESLQPPFEDLPILEGGMMEQHGEGAKSSSSSQVPRPVVAGDAPSHAALGTSGVSSGAGTSAQASSQQLCDASAIPYGLYNGSNMCFINASLQGLFALPPLRRLLAAYCTRELLAQFPVQEWKDEVAYDLPLLDRLALTLHHSVTTKKVFEASLFTKVRYHGDYLYEGRQEDAHEFLHSRTVLSESAGATLSQLFQCVDVPQLVCGSCGDIGAGARECCTCLSLPLLHRDGTNCNTVGAALQEYVLQEECMWACFGCTDAGRQRVGSSTKQTKFVRLPAALVIHLVRWDARGAALVHFVQPDIDIHLQGRRYTLNAVVCHVGPSCRGGHYLTFAQYGEQWWLFNDGMRRMAKEHEIAQWSRAGWDDKTYLLMYSAAT